MITGQQVKEVLRGCYDPEIPLNVLDLGLIYDIRINSGKVEIDMTLTAQGCPMQALISRGIEQKIRKLEGVEDVKVNIVWNPPWAPEKISEEGKKILGLESNKTY